MVAGVSGIHRLYLIDPGPRPSFGLVARHLWGPCNYDSDGNADAPPEGGWTELTVTRRPEYIERVDIDPLDDELPLVLVIRSDTERLARAAARFLQDACGGELTGQPPR